MLFYIYDESGSPIGVRYHGLLSAEGQFDTNLLKSVKIIMEGKCLDEKYKISNDGYLLFDDVFRFCGLQQFFTHRKS